jgi:YVTN family beta-propeller protein
MTQHDSHRLGLRASVLTATLTAGITLYASVAPAQYRAYVTTLNNNGPGSVAVIDTATNAVVGTLAAGLGPYLIATSPDGALVYVVEGNDKAIDVFGAATGNRLHTVKLPDPNRISPQGFAITPDGAFAYVSNGDNGFLEPGTVFVIDMDAGTVVNKILFDRAYRLALSPDATTLYVDGDPGLGIIDTAASSLTATVGVYSYGPLVVSPDGQVVYVAGCQIDGDSYEDARICVVDASTNAASSVHLASGSSAVNGLALSPDGRILYVAHQDASSDAGALAVFDTASRTLTADIPIGNSPNGVAVTPDGRAVYVTNLGTDTVSAIDAATNAVTATIPVGQWPGAIVIAPAPGSATAPTPTRRPTRTPTVAPPTPTRSGVSIAISSATAERGDAVTITATLETASTAAAAVQNDITFATAVPIFACTVNPDIGKDLTAFEISTAGMRAIVLGDNVDPIPDASVLYTCTVRVTTDAAPGAQYSLHISHVIASDPNGVALSAAGTSGVIRVPLPPALTQTPSPSPTPTITSRPPPTCVANCDGPRAVAYIADFDSNNVVVLDTARDQVSATIPLPVGVGPLDVAIAPDGRSVYVTTLTPGTLPQLMVIDTATNSVTATIPLDTNPDSFQRLPHDIAVARDGRFVYVAGGMHNNIAVIDVADASVVAHIALPGFPNSIAASPDGRFAYATHNGPYCPSGRTYTCPGTVDVIDLDPNSATFRTVIGTLSSPGADPVHIAVSSDSSVAYALNQNNPADTVTVFDLTTGAVTTSIPLNWSPIDIALSADGRTAFVTKASPPAVDVIDTATNSVTGTIAVDTPSGIAVTPDGQRVYVTAQSAGRVLEIDTVSNTLTAMIPAGQLPRAIAIGIVPLAPTATPVSVVAGSAAQTDTQAAATGSGGCSMTPPTGSGLLVSLPAALGLWRRRRRV